PPALIYLLGALIVPFLRGRVRQVFALAVPVVGLANFYLISKGIHWKVDLLEFELVLGRADGWSLISLTFFPSSPSSESSMSCATIPPSTFRPVSSTRAARSARSWPETSSLSSFSGKCSAWERSSASSREKRPP